MTPAELWARRAAELELSALEGRRGNAGGSERARGHWQLKAGAWARGQAVAAARRVTPACGRHAADVLCRGRGVARRPAGERRGAREKGRRVELGWAEARWAGAGGALLQAACWRAGPASAGGPETRRRPDKEGKTVFQIYFQWIFFKCHLSTIILSKKMTSFENVPKMKVV